MNRWRNLLQLPNDGDYRVAWFFSFGLAILFAPFVVAFKNQAPWLIAVPVGLGALAVLLFEVTHSRSKGALEALIVLPEGYHGLKAYENLLALEIKHPKKASKGQLPLLPGFEEPRPHNSLRILRDERGTEISVVNCDRYSALLITYLLDNLDKVTDHALAAGLVRFGRAGKGGIDLQALVQDKSVREVIKADFRGNLVMVVSKGGEKVLKDLIKATEEAKAKEAAAQTPSALRAASY